MSSYKTTFLGQNQGALQSPCNPTTSERIVAAVGICLNSYSWCNFWFKLCTWYNLGTPPETRGSSQTVNSLSFAAALILTQGTKRTLTGPHFSEISSVLFEAQLSADSWLWKKKFTTRSIWLMKGEKVTWSLSEKRFFKRCVHVQKTEHQPVQSSLSINLQTLGLGHGCEKKDKSLVRLLPHGLLSKFSSIISYISHWAPAFFLYQKRVGQSRCPCLLGWPTFMDLRIALESP